MLHYRRTVLTPALESVLLPLLQSHDAETTPYPDIPLDVDWPVYYAAQDAGMFRLYTAHMPGDLDDVSTDIVGYDAYFVRTAPHYRTILTAAQDLVYLAHPHRGHFSHFASWVDSQLREDGVRMTLRSIATSRDFGPVLERLGYEHAGWLYTRRLDD